MKRVFKCYVRHVGHPEDENLSYWRLTEIADSEQAARDYIHRLNHATATWEIDYVEKISEGATDSDLQTFANKFRRPALALFEDLISKEEYEFCLRLKVPDLIQPTPKRRLELNL